MARSRLYRSRFLKVGPQVLIFQHFWDLHYLRTSAPLQTKEDSQTLTIFPSRFDQFGKTFAKIGERPTFAECGDIVDQFWVLFSFSDFAKSIKLLFWSILLMYTVHDIVSSIVQYISYASFQYYRTFLYGNLLHLYMTCCRVSTFYFLKTLISRPELGWTQASLGWAELRAA